MDSLEYGTNPPPFWRQFGFFFAYLKQEKLYYQITLLALANFLLVLPIILIDIIISAVLFLVSYKLAFEVLHAVASGRFIYADDFSRTIDSKIGLKAIAMGVFQILVFILIYPSDQALGLVLMILSMLATPAYLMLLSQTQMLSASINPFRLMTVMNRIGFEYLMLLVFFLLCAAFNMLVRYYVSIWIPGVIGSVLIAWILYFMLVFTFLVIGYVMYRHAETLGHDTIDVEVVEAKPIDQVDPIKARIKQLIDNKKPQEAIQIIKELKEHDNRIDLDSYLAQAENLLLLTNRQRPVQRLQNLVDERQYKTAIEMYLSYAEDGHLMKPKEAVTISKLINYSFTKNQFKQVLKLCRNFDQRYPLEHQEIVDNYFLVAKIHYQNNQIDEAKQLLRSLLDKYSNTSNVQDVKSYLLGINKMSKE